MYVLNFLGTIIAGMKLPKVGRAILCESKNAFTKILPLDCCNSLIGRVRRKRRVAGFEHASSFSL